MYIQYIQGIFQSRLGTADHALVTSNLHNNDNLITWTVIHMTAAKFKPLIFSVSCFALSNVANIFIFMILDNFCLLPAIFCYVIINVRYIFRRRNKSCYLYHRVSLVKSTGTFLYWSTQEWGSNGNTSAFGSVQKRASRPAHQQPYSLQEGAAIIQ
jgi:hypothetical protein